jgi:hypothetical protein
LCHVVHQILACNCFDVFLTVQSRFAFAWTYFLLRRFATLSFYESDWRKTVCFIVSISDDLQVLVHGRLSRRPLN